MKVIIKPSEELEIHIDEYTKIAHVQGIRDAKIISKDADRLLECLIESSIVKVERSIDTLGGDN